MKRAFSLVELSIVLVILGLLVGGILAGRSLIKAAELRSSLAYLDRVTTATNAFKDKYIQLPGDISNAVSFGLGTLNGIGTNGTGDGTVLLYRYFDSANLSNTGRTEIYNYWYHLAAAGLIDGTFTGVNNAAVAAPIDLTGYMPQLKFSQQKTFIVAGTLTDAGTSASMGNGYILTAFDGPVASRTNYTLTAEEAWRMDAKLDDGMPNAGVVRTFYISVGPYWSSGGPNGCNYLGVYDLAGTRDQSAVVNNPPLPDAVECGLLIKAGW